MKEEKSALDEQELFKTFVVIWTDYYEYHKKTNVTFSGMHGVCIKRLIKKIERKLLYHGGEVSETTIIDFFIVFLQSIAENKKNLWFYERLELNIIDSKFDTIFSNSHEQRLINQNSRIDDAASDFFEGK